MAEILYVSMIDLTIFLLAINIVICTSITKSVNSMLQNITLINKNQNYKNNDKMKRKLSYLSPQIQMKDVTETVILVVTQNTGLVFCGCRLKQCGKNLEIEQ